MGSRQHLFRIEAGGALFGISAAESGFVLVAVGTPDTRLAKLPLPAFRAAAADPGNAGKIAPMVEGWVAKLCSVLTRSIYPRPVIDIMLRPGEKTTPGKSKTVSTQKELLWLAGAPEDSLYIGLEFAGDADSLFPLSDDTWLQMGADGEMETFRTADVLETPGLWLGLQRYHDLFITCHTTNLNLEKVDEYLKIKDTAAYREKAMQQAVTSLAAVIEGVEKRAGTEASLDPLVTACGAVASASGVDFQPPPSFKSEKYRDPLRALLHAAGLRVRQVSLSGEWWREDAGAMLAFTARERRPVALLPASPGTYRIFEPQAATSVPATSGAAADLDDRAYVFYRTLPSGNMGLRQLIRFGFAAARRDIAVIILAGIAASVLGFAVPLATGILFNSIIPDNERTTLFQMLAGLAVSAIAIGLFQMARGVSLLRIETRADTALQGALWDRLLRLPARFFRSYPAGDLATRAGGIDAIREILSGAAATLLLGGLFSLVNIALLFYYSPALAAWMVLVIVIASLFMFVHGRQMLRAFREVQETLQRVSGVVFQLLTGITKLRSSGTETSAFTLWVNRFRDMRLAQFRFGKLQNYGEVFYAVLPLLSLTLAYYQFSRIAGTTSLQTGSFLAFVSAFSVIMASIVSVGSLYPSLMRVIPLYESLKPILEAVPEVDVQKTLCDELKGRIEINHVSFRYGADSPPALRDLSIQISPGEHVALVGPSGSGKSTVLRLLLGFEKPESGTIYYDGQDLSKLDVTSVRRQIGTVLQSSSLTTGTIYENLAGSFAELTERDVWEAARTVGVEEDIRQMPMGMFTVVSEGGSTLSGGQRQRLMLARALVRRPRVVMMDEATSFLDNQTQEIVSRSLDRMKITRITIAHRLSTIVNADTIYVIKDGAVVEKGGYRELMEKNGLFTELAQRQMS